LRDVQHAGKCVAIAVFDLEFMLVHHYRFNIIKNRCYRVVFANLMPLYCQRMSGWKKFR